MSSAFCLAVARLTVAIYTAHDHGVSKQQVEQLNQTLPASLQNRALLITQNAYGYQSPQVSTDTKALLAELSCETHGAGSFGDDRTYSVWDFE